MAPTYSINVGTPQEANTYTQISDILNLLPDNTQKLIDPRDVRDAVFSNWENSVFRYTTNSSSDAYIGVSRSDVKAKILFGKKELSGMSILNNTLYTSDTDIFFYNTKTDGNPSQDLKISLLAGASSSLYPYAPYIGVNYISGATTSLDLYIAHNQPFGGNISILAGNNGRIDLNGLVLPSSNEMSVMVSSPTSSTAGDLFLVRTVGGYLELKTPTSIITSVGTPGSEFNIYGSTVSLNGYSLEFTDLNATTVDFGGIPSGTTFSNVPLVEMIRQMLYPYLAPLTTVSVSTSIRERVHSIAGTFSPYDYSLTKRTDDITSSNIKITGNSILYNVSGPVISGGGFITNNYTDVFTFSGANIQSNVGGVFTFSVSATDGVNSFTSSTNLKFIYPYFYGFSATTSNINTIVSGDLTKLVNDYADQTISLAGTGYLHYCYPSYYGNLDKIYDGNGFLIWQTGDATWTYSVASVDSPSGYWSGASYLVYRPVSPVTIPLPSQNYRFNY